MISNDVKLFPHRPVIIVRLPRNCFCLVTQRSWGGVLRDESETAAGLFVVYFCSFFRVFVPLYLV